MVVPAIRYRPGVLKNGALQGIGQSMEAPGGGVLLARVVEQPFLRLRDRLYPSRGRKPDTTARRGPKREDEGRCRASICESSCQSKEYTALAK